MIDQRTGWWWSNQGFTTFDELNGMFWACLKQVFPKSSIHLYLIQLGILA